MGKRGFSSFGTVSGRVLVWGGVLVLGMAHGQGLGAAPEPEAVRVRASKACGEAQCHQLEVTCGGLPARQVRVREFAPTPGSQGAIGSRGTIVFATGVFGIQPYDHHPERAKTLAAARAAGFEVFEVRWGGGRKGWGTDAAGVGYARALCGYAAVVRWLHGARADRPELLCAQGNSGGGLQIAYGLAQYGLADIVDLAVLSGGPPISRVDQYCFTRRKFDRELFWKDNGRRMTDYLMGWEGAGDSCKNGQASAAAVAALEATSLVSPRVRRLFDYPHTRVMFLESEGDKSTSQGRIYHDAITSQKSWEIVPGRQHGVDRTLPGAQRVRDVLLGECRLP